MRCGTVEVPTETGWGYKKAAPRGAAPVSESESCKEERPPESSSWGRLPSPALTPPGMPARHRGGFLRRLIRLPSFHHTRQSLFLEPLDAHGLMGLRTTAHSPPAFAAEGKEPGLVGLDPVCLQELEDRIPTLKLLEFDKPNLAPEPLIQFLHQASGATVSVIRHPAVDVAIEPSDLLVKGAGTVPPSQPAYAILKTANTLRRYAKGPVVERGGSRGTIARSLGPPPISPHLRVTSASSRRTFARFAITRSPAFRDCT